MFKKKINGTKQMIPCYNLVDPLVTLEKLVLEDLESLQKFYQEISHDEVERLRQEIKDFNSFKAEMGWGNQWVEEAYYSNMKEEFVPIFAKRCKIKNFLPLSESRENPEALLEFSTHKTITKSVQLNFEYNGINLNV